MADILGGKEKRCTICGGTVLTIRIGGEIYYQCRDCSALTKNYQEEEIKIYELKECLVYE